jgi:hypothetical protein
MVAATAAAPPTAAPPTAPLEVMMISRYHRIACLDPAYGSNTIA